MSGLTFHIRLLDRSEADALRTLRLQALRDHPAFFGAAYEDEIQLSVEDFARRMPGPPGGILGAFVSDAHGGARLVAMATLFIPAGRKQRHKGQIFGLYVEPGCRGSGVGRAVMQALIDKARTESMLNLLLLGVGLNNSAARGLYASLGFRTYGVEPRALRLGDNFVDEELMALPLQPEPGKPTPPG